MLKMQNRLLTPINRAARVITTPLLTVRYHKNDLAISRFGFVVAKRAAKSAVVRNRTKRVVRSFVEGNIEKIQKGYDMLFIIRRSILANEDQKDKLETVMKRSNLWE